MGKLHQQLRFVMTFENKAKKELDTDVQIKVKATGTTLCAVATLASPWSVFIYYVLLIVEWASLFFSLASCCDGYNP